MTEGSAVTATKGPDGTVEGDVWYAKGECTNPVVQPLPSQVNAGGTALMDGAVDFTNTLNGHISVFGSEMQHLLPTKDMTVEIWVRWTHGGTDWAGPVSASQNDGSTERGWIL